MRLRRDNYNRVIIFLLLINIINLNKLLDITNFNYDGKSIKKEHYRHIPIEIA